MTPASFSALQSEYKTIQNIRNQIDTQYGELTLAYNKSIQLRSAGEDLLWGRVGLR